MTWTCIANPSAVEPSTAPSASEDLGRVDIRPPSPPAAPGTHSRWRPAATIASAARGSNASPSSSAAGASIASSSRPRRSSSPVMSSAPSQRVSALTVRPARRVLDERRRAAARAWPPASRSSPSASRPADTTAGGASQSAQAAAFGPEPGDLLVGRERSQLALVRVDRRSWPAVRASNARDPGRSHPALLRQRRDLRDVDRAPVAALAPRREPLDVAPSRRSAASDAVDPADAQRLVDGLRPGRRWARPIPSCSSPSQSSSAVSWLASNQSRNADGVAKKRMSCGTSFTMEPVYGLGGGPAVASAAVGWDNGSRHGPANWGREPGRIEPYRTRLAVRLGKRIRTVNATAACAGVGDQPWARHSVSRMA